MANELTWYTEPNIAIADSSSVLLMAKSTLWLIKALLVGNVGTFTQGRWTVIGSSDSVTAALDGVDRWGVTYDPTKLVRAAAGTAHSWIVLKSPDALGPLYMVIDWSTNNDRLWFVWFSKTAPTGGTITARAAAADNWSAVDDTNTYNQFVASTTAVAHRVSISKTAAGHFAVMLQKTASGRFDGFFGIMPLTDTRPGDLYPFVSVFDPMDTTSILSSYGNTSAVLRSVNHSGNGNNTSRCVTRSANGASILFGALAIPSISDWGSTPNSAFTNTSQVVRIPGVDTADGKYDDLPAYLICAGGYLKGRVQDLRWCPSTLAEGSLDDGSSLGSPGSTACGDMWAPWTAPVAPFL